MSTNLINPHELDIGKTLLAQKLDLVARIADLTRQLTEKEEQLVSVLQREAATAKRHDDRTDKLERQLAEAREVKPLEWVEGLHETRDDDGGPREGVLRRLWAWRASGYLIIQQDGDRGLFILRGKSDGIGLVVPTLEAAKAAAQADYTARILSALKGPTP